MPSSVKELMEPKKLCTDTKYKNRQAVKKAYPDAVKIVKVTGGWMVFFLWTDYEIWKKMR